MKLVDSGLEECKKRGIDKVKVLVASDNPAANRLYQSSGFQIHSHVESHGIKSNIYVVNI